MHRNLICRIVSVQRTCFRRKTDNAINIEKLENASESVELVDEDLKTREEEIERKRNKSRLKPQHQNMLHERNPFPEPIYWYQGTLKYARQMYGRYGELSGVNPALCFPTKEELDEKLGYEQVAYPFTIPQMIETVKQKREEKVEQIRLRQEDVVKKMQKLEQWKQDLRNKIIKKETEVKVAKERKEKLVEEVRRHFGYKIDPKDEKFKEMLEKKEKEQKKAMKLAKKKEKEEKMISALIQKQSENVEVTENKENE